MPSLTTDCYFHPDALRHRYLSDLAAAVAQARITEAERLWLELLVDNLRLARNSQVRPQAGRLNTAHGFWETTGIANGLVFGGEAGSWTVYWYSPTDGLQAFASRALLVDTLNARLGMAPAEQPIWSAEWFADDPFEQLQRMLVSRHAERLQRVSQHLLQLPALRDGGPVLFAKSSAAGEAKLFKPYETRLQAYWDAAAKGEPSRRQLVASVLADGFASALLKERHRGALAEPAFDSLRSLLPGHAVASDLAAGTALLVIGGESVQLAGVLLIELGSAVYVFSAADGLRHFASLVQLGEHYTSAAARASLLTAVSRGSQALVTRAASVQLQMQSLAGDVFLRMAQGCIELQNNNLKHTLGKLEGPVAKASCAVDDALDIRHLLDRWLVAMGGLGRWREVTAKTVTDHLPSAEAVATAATQNLALPARWADFQPRAQQQAELIMAVQPGAASCAEGLLNSYLALLDGLPEGAGHLWLQLEGGPAINVVCLFLQRLTGCSAAPLAAQAQVMQGSPSLPVAQRQATGLGPQLLDTLLAQAVLAFAPALAAQAQRGRTAQVRAHGMQLLPGKLAADLLEGLLRQCLAMEQRLARLKAANLSMLEQVVRQPVLAQRAGLGESAVEVYEVAVQYDVRQPQALLSGVFLLQQSLSGLSSLLLWSPQLGLQEFDSEAQIRAAISLDLRDLASRTQWLDQVCTPAREQLAYALEQPETRLAIEFTAVEGHFIDHLQQVEAKRQGQAVVAALQWARKQRSTAQALQNAVAAAQAQPSWQGAIDTLAQAHELEQLLAVLPDWIAAATATQLSELGELLQAYYATHRPGLDFLAGISGLQAHGRAKVQAALAADFPGVQLDPDLITVAWVQYVAAPALPGQLPSSIPAATISKSGSLTAYSINHLLAPPDATLQINTSPGLPKGLDIAYVAALVRKLDVAASYRLLLERAFSPQDPDYLRRLHCFAGQFAAKLRLAGYSLTLQKQLGAKAWAFVERVLDMPDGLAREPLDGQQVVVSPLQFVAEAGSSADPAAGMYLIGPGAPALGPWVLLVLTAEGIDLKEYPSKEALVVDLQGDPVRAGLVLERLAPQARQLYANGGFSEPHLPWSTEASFSVPWSSPRPPTLLIEPLLGNAHRAFFESTLSLLLAQAREQSMTTAEGDRLGYRFLLSLGADQLLAFLPGKLGALVAAWQARALLVEAADALGEQHWGEAFAQFCAALAMLATAREGTAGRLPKAVESPRAVVPRAVRLAGDRLSEFEVHDVSISQLEKEPLLNLYRDPQRNHRYAVVGGKLYRVRSDQGTWHVVLHEVTGPAIRLNTAHEWELSLGLKGGGPVLSRLDGAMINFGLDEIFTVEASGLLEIRRLYRDKARRIGQAHAWALNYVLTALRNLEPIAGSQELPAASQAIFKEFFGVPAADEVLLKQVRKSLGQLHQALVDPSLSPFSSERFVVGTGKNGYEDSPAFTYINDPQQRIFLGHRFFGTAAVRLKPPPSGQNGFDHGAHFRATVLLHELSHIVNNSHDIAYIEAVSPYLDLLEGSGSYYRSAKANIEKYQQRTLSHLTPREELFTSSVSEPPRDLDKRDNGAVEAVLKLSGRKTLEQARNVFLNDARRRADIIMANADSVALLTTLLGRKIFTPPNP